MKSLALLALALGLLAYSAAAPVFAQGFSIEVGPGGVRAGPRYQEYRDDRVIVVPRRRQRDYDEGSYYRPQDRQYYNDRDDRPRRYYREY